MKHTIITLSASSKRLSLLVLAGLFTLPLTGFSTSLSAETRTYQSSLPVHKVIPAFVDELASVRFKIVKTYSEAKDGKLGFAMFLLPGERYADISFFSDEKQNQSFVKVTTQDHNDSELFYKIFCTKLKMTEPGVKDLPQTDSNWPLPANPPKK